TRSDTTAANVGWRSRLRGLMAGSYYQPADPDLFRRTLARLPMVRVEAGRAPGLSALDSPAAPLNLRNFTFVDMGPGKGRALLLAAEQPFARVIGVEVLPELHAIAQQNIAAAASRLVCHKIESISADARIFQFPDGPLVVFLFNPLP